MPWDHIDGILDQWVGRCALRLLSWKFFWKAELQAPTDKRERCYPHWHRAAGLDKFIWRDHLQPADVRTFQPPTESSGFKYLYVPRSHRLARQETRTRLSCLVGILVHDQYYDVAMAQFVKAEIKPLENFDPLDISILADPESKPRPPKIRKPSCLIFIARAVKKPERQAWRAFCDKLARGDFSRATATIKRIRNRRNQQVRFTHPYGPALGAQVLRDYMANVYSDRTYRRWRRAMASAKLSGGMNTNKLPSDSELLSAARKGKHGVLFVMLWLVGIFPKRCQRSSPFETVAVNKPNSRTLMVQPLVHSHG
ncbi:uncharacterized protein BYT42DRAFT_611571 [Radiomyces spectabilis]|uniref:uncharacterized protein n=1 Tax=Radiomyces spectabilis TaxID=64574 RepID=UPI00221FC6D5|nr:uncharacterized protein BYT42DRAFT_611571 [Radiomyces spectabilis]KAI8388538.1 hypothetical protein BYT42DRAFT_611571 [Radiomyces spectabilis]